MSPRHLSLLALLLILLGISGFAWLRYKSIYITDLKITITPSSSQKPIIEKAIDENHLFGFIQSATTTNGERSVKFDLAEFISNDSTSEDGPRAADLAAVRDGKCEVGEGVKVGECAPNGFYIRNNDPSERDLFVSATATFVIMNSSATSVLYDSNGFQKPTSVSWSAFVKAVGELYESERMVPYRLILENGNVVRIEEVYIP